MVRGSLIRAGIAAAVSFTLAVGLSPLSAGSARAEPVAGEVVIPASYVLSPQTRLLSAGPSGFLRHEPTLEYLWTSYAGVDTKLDMSLTDAFRVPDFGAGSDIVATPNFTDRTVTLRDMTTGRSRTVAIPLGHTYVSTLGSTVVTTAQDASTGHYTWHLFDSHDDGSVTRRAVAGVPEGVTAATNISGPLGDARGQVVQYQVGSTPHTGFLDVEQGRLIPLPYAAYRGTGTVVLTSTHLLWLHDGTVSVHSRADLTATPRTVPLTGASQVLGMVGETLVVGRHDPSLGPFNYLDPVWRVEAVALDGRTVKTLLTRSGGSPMPTPDGRLLVQGGPDVDRWGIFVVEAADGGDVTVRKAAEAYPRKLQAVSGLTFTQGRLNTLEQENAWQKRRHLYTREIGVTGSLAVGARTARGPAPASCDTTACPDLHDTGDGRTVVSGLSYGRTDDDRQPHLLGPNQPMPGTRIDGSRTYHAVAAVGGRFAALTVVGGTGTETRVVDVDTGATVFTTTASVEALWGTTLWVRDGNDAVAPVDLLTGQRGAQVWFGSGCLLENLQAVGRWLLWTCVGSASGQGVYDTVKRTNLRLVSGHDWSWAKLGDGFVASEVDGQLKVTDVRDGTPRSHTAGAFASWRPWDVDPYTGVIAHLGADDGIHLVPSGVPVSPLAQLDATVATSAHVKDATGHWSPKWWLSKPAASWTLVIRSQTSGAVVRTLSGGLTRGVVATAWTGKDDRRRVMPNGTYTWTLTATPADGQGAALTRSGTMKLSHECHIGDRPQLVVIRCS
ncbi:FlgD immunoglobulin-like domain containing protein [Micromonospora sp. NPDC047465]|uniref:FlgD immunoglobulin-like domain containing protein n=1 Tax=Micromonospora sp. NPDC047465 TaxID=3154813 RepID=UPI00340B050B